LLLTNFKPLWQKANRKAYTKNFLSDIVLSIGDSKRYTLLKFVIVCESFEHF